MLKSRKNIIITQNHTTVPSNHVYGHCSLQQVGQLDTPHIWDCSLISLLTLMSYKSFVRIHNFLYLLEYNDKYKNPYLNSCAHINVDVLLCLPQLQVQC
jgi:hypothetical protein